ncbi:MAG: LysR family transcriptional regulator [Muricoprocola sp.]
MKVGAIIVAAQDLAQDKTGNEELETFLPMLPLEGSTVIKREISTLRKAGISPILVAGGYQAAVLKNHLSHNGVIFHEDIDYAKHDWKTSARIAIQETAPDCDALLLIPVECPAFTLETVRKLAECEEDTQVSYQGKNGKICFCLMDGEYLKEETEKFSGNLDVDDAGVLLDITHQENLQTAEVYIRQMRDSRALGVKTKVVLSRTEDFFGPGVFHLLQHIDETGSIQAAAKEMGMSYSKCWKLLNRAEEQMGFPFLNRCNGGRHGGNSTITEEGRTFMNRYQAMMEDMKRISQNFFDIYFQDYQ